MAQAALSVPLRWYVVFGATGTEALMRLGHPAEDVNMPEFFPQRTNTNCTSDLGYLAENERLKIVKINSVPSTLPAKLHWPIIFCPRTGMDLAEAEKLGSSVHAVGRVLRREGILFTTTPQLLREY